MQGFLPTRLLVLTAFDAEVICLALADSVVVLDEEGWSGTSAGLAVPPPPGWPVGPPEMMEARLKHD